jgi:hypothetical protein
MPKQNENQFLIDPRERGYAATSDATLDLDLCPNLS